MKKPRKENRQGVKKRKILLEASGKVFAKSGYKGTTIRAIAKEAKTRPSALSYHFKSKKRLFKETLKYHVLDSADFRSMFVAFKNADPSKPMSVSMAIYDGIGNMINACHGPKGQIKNLSGLLKCMINEGGRDCTNMLHDIADETMVAVHDVIRKANPKLSNTDIFWLDRLLWAMLFYTIYGEDLMLSATNLNKYTPEMLNSLIFECAKVCCILSGLPVPNAQSTWECPKLK